MSTSTPSFSRIDNILIPAWKEARHMYDPASYNGDRKAFFISLSKIITQFTGTIFTDEQVEKRLRTLRTNFSRINLKYKKGQTVSLKEKDFHRQLFFLVPFVKSVTDNEHPVYVEKPDNTNQNHKIFQNLNHPFDEKDYQPQASSINNSEKRLIKTEAVSTTVISSEEIIEINSDDDDGADVAGAGIFGENEDGIELYEEIVPTKEVTATETAQVGATLDHDYGCYKSSNAKLISSFVQNSSITNLRAETTKFAALGSRDENYMASSEGNLNKRPPNSINFVNKIVEKRTAESEVKDFNFNKKKRQKKASRFADYDASNLKIPLIPSTAQRKMKRKALTDEIYALPEKYRLLCLVRLLKIVQNRQKKCLKD